MEQSKAIRILVAGFRRFYLEGYRKWSKQAVYRSINPIDEHHDIDDPDIQNALKQLEKDGVIILKYEDDCYLEVL